MNENVLILLKALVLIVPFVLLILLGGKANLKKQERHRQGLINLPNGKSVTSGTALIRISLSLSSFSFDMNNTDLWLSTRTK